MKSLSAFTLLAMLTGCGNEEPNSQTKDPEIEESQAKEVKTEVDEAEEVEEDTGAEAFNYLPKNETMQMNDFDEATDGEMGTIRYTIEDSTAEEVLDDYFEMLEEDNWEIIEDSRPDLIKAEKDEHEAIIVTGQIEEDVLLTIVTK